MQPLLLELGEKSISPTAVAEATISAPLGREFAYKQMAIQFIGAITLLATVFVSLGVVVSHVVGLGYLGVIIHCSIFLVAATTVFIPRHVCRLDPRF